MIYLTKNEIESVESALRDLGIYPPWDVPVEKYTFYLLIGLCGKVANIHGQLIELEKRVAIIQEQVHDQSEGK